MSISERRRLLVSKDGIKQLIPVEYEQLEWIEAKKGPAIIIPTCLTLDTEIEMVGQQMETQTSYLSAYGCDAPLFGMSYSGNSAVYASFGNVKDSTGGSKNWQGNFHKFVQNRVGWWLDDVLQKQYNASSVSVNQARHLALFARMSSKNTLERFSWWRVKYFIVRAGTIELNHLIPCCRKADGELGMYDLVSKAFLPNVGSGSFTRS